MNTNSKHPESQDPLLDLGSINTPIRPSIEYLLCTRPSIKISLCWVEDNGRNLSGCKKKQSLNPASH